MKKNKVASFIVAVLLLAGGGACRPQQLTTPAPAAAPVKEEVLQVLALQAESWSKGDLEGFMEGYWKSDSLVFIGKSGLTYGWQQTLQNYQASYPGTAAMGKLQFNILEYKPLAQDKVLVIGKWHLTREAGNLQGHFSVIFQHFPQGWKVIADHSS